jgi:hypothetical protein
LDNRKDIGIYPLKQFAHVIHGNPNTQGRTAMGSPSPNGICSSGKYDAKATYAARREWPGGSFDDMQPPDIQNQESAMVQIFLRNGLLQV